MTSENKNNFQINQFGKDIPPAVSMQGWKDIPIHECGDRLVSLNVLSRKSRLVASPEYYRLGIKHASDEIQVREGVAEKLIKATELLPSGHRLVIFDAYRPLEVQEALFNSFKDQLRTLNNDRTDDELTSMTEKYVSLPSYDPLKPSPHATGGAVDLSISGEDESLLDMGTLFDSFDISSRTDFFRDSNVSIHNNRKLLFQVMSESGFTNYPEEWWHYDSGNQFWGHLSNKSAVYGLVKQPPVEKQPTMFTPITEGPFVLNLKTEGGSSSLVTEGRIIVGGYERSTEALKLAIKAIGNLPSGLNYQELYYEATEILNSYNLFQVDF